MTESIVRRAEPRDEDQLMHLCRLLYGENALFEMDDELVRHTLYRAFAKHDGIIGVVDGPDGLQGAIYLLISRFWYSRQHHLEELFNFVHPDCRRSGHAKALIGYAKVVSDELHIPLNIGVISNERTEAKVRLYQRQLGAPAGAFFFYNGQFADGPAAALSAAQ